MLAGSELICARCPADVSIIDENGMLVTLPHREESQESPAVLCTQLPTPLPKNESREEEREVTPIGDSECLGPLTPPPPEEMEEEEGGGEESLLTNKELNKMTVKVEEPVPLGSLEVVRWSR